MAEPGIVRPIFVLEPLTDSTRRRFGSFLGIGWFGTPLWWVSALWMLSVGIILGLIIGPGDGGVRILSGVLYALILAATALVHAAGHLTSGRMVAAAMNGVLLTATLPVNLYDDGGKTISRRVHLARSLGGPSANALVGVIALLIAIGAGGPILWMIAIVNLAFVAAALAPVPSMDGGVIWLKKT